MRYRLLLILWLLTDLLLFVSLYTLAYFLRVGWILSTDFPFDRFLFTTIITAPLWLLVLGTTRTFGLTRNQATIRNGAYIAYTALVGVALFTLAYYFRYITFFSRLLLLHALFYTFVGVWVWHILFQRFERWCLRLNPPTFPTLIIGTTREAAELIRSLNKNRNPLVPVAILDSQGNKENFIESVPIRGKLHKLEQVLAAENITHLIQCSDLEQSLNFLTACRKRRITYMLLPSTMGMVERDEWIDSVEGQPVTVVSPSLQWWHWFIR
ncbi:hypothetical protein HYZ98_05145 [Candidatus Peregrinibacteria bacterium]|nr:hypothetical protein [Candidatus Peregrinibacteria bacterium]